MITGKADDRTSHFNSGKDISMSIEPNASPLEEDNWISIFPWGPKLKSGADRSADEEELSASLHSSPLVSFFSSSSSASSWSVHVMVSIVRSIFDGEESLPLESFIMISTVRLSRVMSCARLRRNTRN